MDVIKKFLWFSVLLISFSWADTTIKDITILPRYGLYGTYSNGFFYTIFPEIWHFAGTNNGTLSFYTDQNDTNKKILEIGLLEKYYLRPTANLIFEDNGRRPVILVDHNYCYILGSKLHVIDITNPFKPKLVSEIPLSSLVVDAKKRGNFIYAFEVENYDVANTPLKGRGGLEVIDISNPDDPKIVGNSNYLDYGYGSGSLSIAFYDAAGIAIYGNYAICSSGQKLAVFNIAYVNTPLLENVIQVDKYAYKMGMKDHILFLITSKEDPPKNIYLTVYDVQNPLNPKFLTEIPIENTTTSQPEPWNIEIFERKNLVFVSIPEGIKIFNVFNPSKPYLQHSENTNYPTTYDNFTFPIGRGFFFYAENKILRMKDVQNSSYLLHIEKGWNLKGSSHKIKLQKNLILFGNNTIIWSWKNKNWYVWSGDSKLIELMKKFKINQLDQIEKNQGFWIDSELENTYLISSNDTDIPKYIELNEGWNLIGTSSIINTESLKDPDILYLWKWTGNSWLFWSPNPLLSSMAEIYYGIKTFSWILPGDGVWIKSKAKKTISLEETDKTLVENWILEECYTSPELLICAKGKYQHDNLRVTYTNTNNIENDLSHKKAIIIYLSEDISNKNDDFLMVRINPKFLQKISKLELTVGNKNCTLPVEEIQDGKTFDCL